jgi:hypothetical protein
MFPHQRAALTPQQKHALMLAAAQRFSKSTADWERREALADWAAGFDGVHPDARQSAMDRWADTYLPKAPSPPPATTSESGDRIKTFSTMRERDAAEAAERARSFNAHVARDAEQRNATQRELYAGVRKGPATTPPVTQAGGSPGAKLNGVLVEHPHGREPTPTPPTAFAPRPIEPAPAGHVPWRPAPTAVGRAGDSMPPLRAPAASHAGGSIGAQLRGGGAAQPNERPS